MKIETTSGRKFCLRELVHEPYLHDDDEEGGS